MQVVCRGARALCPTIHTIHLAETGDRILFKVRIGQQVGLIGNGDDPLRDTFIIIDVHQAITVIVLAIGAVFLCRQGKTTQQKQKKVLLASFVNLVDPVEGLVTGFIQSIIRRNDLASPGDSSTIHGLQASHCEPDHARQLCSLECKHGNIRAVKFINVSEYRKNF